MQNFQYVFLSGLSPWCCLWQSHIMCSYNAYPDNMLVKQL